MSAFVHRLIRRTQWLRHNSFLAAAARSAVVVAKPFDHHAVHLQYHPQRFFTFHSTTPAFLAMRRRRHGTKNRRKDKDSDQELYDNPLKHTPVVDTDEFCKAASTLLTKLENALENMKAKNEMFVLTRTREDLGEIFTIDLGPKEGSYRIEFSEEDHIFEYTSPISGKIIYNLSASTGEWVGSEDGHSFEGLLVRDLIRQCQGVPKL